MKARLSSTIWMLVFWIGVALFGVLGLAYHAGKESGGLSLLDAPSLPWSASGRSARRVRSGDGCRAARSYSSSASAC